MSPTTREHIKRLETLRLPELRDCFREIVGEATRSPNKKYLLKRISETLDAQGQASVSAEGGAEEAVTADSQRISKSEPEPSAQFQTPRSAMESSSMASTETAQPLVNRAQETLEPERPAESDPSPVDNTQESVVAEDLVGEASVSDEPQRGDNGSSSTVEPEKERLTKRSVPELQALYAEVVGRPTGSSNSRYLIWKIRQARKGRIPIGPARRRYQEGEARSFKVLPLRMEAEVVARLDEARSRLGLPSRMALFRQSLHEYLTRAGEHEVARLFAEKTH